VVVSTAARTGVLAYPQHTTDLNGGINASTFRPRVATPYLLNVTMKSTIFLGLVLPLVSAALECRVFPGDAAWPTPRDWAALNKTVSGRLVATVPIGAVCHEPNYDAAACEAVKAGWHDPALQSAPPPFRFLPNTNPGGYSDESSSSIMAPVWTNRSCDPFTSPDTPCELGNYVRYAIDARSAADITAGLRFVKKHNVRLVIRNTGHDYLGKSTGAGALAIWTHHLKEITYTAKYKGAHKWRGAAMKLGAGVQGFEAYAAAVEKGVVVVGGECETVGIAGGYTQGGGHSALSSRFGLAADQVLEWEVVTADGNLRVANPKKNKELYWALSGGGGGTFGVVTAVTVKAHPDAVTTTAKISWTHDGTAEMVEKWWEAVKFYWAMTPALTDTGAFAVDVYFTGSFSLGPWFGHGITLTESTALLKPLISKLEELGLQHTVNITEYPGYLPAFKGAFDPIAVGIAQCGGRLIPRELLINEPDRVLETVRGIIESGSLIFEITTHPTLKVAGWPDNAVLPAWRENQLNLVVTM
jgi:hypothetical protein